MTLITDLIQEGDTLTLLILIGVLCFIGNKLVEQRVELHAWGLRVSVGAFVVSAVVLGFRLEYVTAGELLGVVFSSLLVAGLVLGPTWIVLTVAGFAWNHCRGVSDAVRQSNETRRRGRATQKERKIEEQEQRRKQREQARLAPERERALREAAERERVEVEREAGLSRQREDLRVACELLYDLHEPEIKERFPRKRVDEFIERYLGDERPVDVVRRRAGELQLLIQQHHESVNPPEQFDSLATLTEWYEEQKSLIERLPIDESYRQDYVIRLNERYAELSERVLERMGR